jgi:WD40 repeat protein
MAKYRFLLLALIVLPGLFHVHAQENPGDLFAISLEHDSPVEGAMWSDDGAQILTWTDDNTVHIWDVVSSIEVNSLALSYDFYRVEWHPPLVAIIDYDVEVWNLDTGEPVFAPEGYGNFYWGENDTYFIRENPDLEVWDVQTNELLARWEDSWEGKINVDTGQLLLWSEELFLFDLDHLNQTIFSYEPQSYISGVEWSNDGSRIIVFDGDMLRILDALTGEELPTIVSGISRYYQSLSPDDNLIALGEPGQKSLTVYSVDTGEQLFQVTDSMLTRYFSIIGTNPSWHANWSPDASKMSAKGGDGVLWIWDARTGDQLLTETHGTGIMMAEWSTSSQYIFTLGQDGSVVLWGVDTANAIFYRLLPQPAERFEWHPTQEKVLIWNENFVEVWDFMNAELTPQDIPEPDVIVAGEVISSELGCSGCHRDGAGAGPPLAGIYGQERVSNDGEVTIADEEYLVRSILNPGAFVVDGYADGIMPHVYADRMTFSELEALVDYIIALSD